MARWTDEDMFRLDEQILRDRQEERQERPGKTREELLALTVDGVGGV